MRRCQPLALESRGRRKCAFSPSVGEILTEPEQNKISFTQSENIASFHSTNQSLMSFDPTNQRVNFHSVLSQLVLFWLSENSPFPIVSIWCPSQQYQSIPKSSIFECSKKKKVVDSVTRRDNYLSFCEFCDFREKGRKEILNYVVGRHIWKWKFVEKFARQGRTLYATVFRPVRAARNSVHSQKSNAFSSVI